MTQQAFLITLSGMGDHEWKLIDADAMAYLQSVIDWNRTDPAPTPSDTLFAAIVEARRAMGEDEDEDLDLKASLTPDADSSSTDNDVALALPPSLFGGEWFHAYAPSPKKLQEFVAKHGLELVEAYDGYIY